MFRHNYLLVNGIVSFPSFTCLYKYKEEYKQGEMWHSAQRAEISEEICMYVCEGETVFIPRMPLIPMNLPFSFKRLQFPVRPAFAISINKSQGQSIKYCGVDLRSPCFSHGQLYVACSRVGSPKNLFILAPGGETKNVVYNQVLS
jgi:hypothetical protein